MVILLKIVLVLFAMMVMALSNIMIFSKIRKIDKDKRFGVILPTIFLTLMVVILTVVSVTLIA